MKLFLIRTAVLTFMCCYETLALFRDYHYSDVSTLLETINTPDGKEYSKYSGEFYHGPLYGEANGDGVRYNLTSLTVPGSSRYIFLASLPVNDPETIDWDTDALPLSDLLTPTDLMSAEYVLVKTDDNAGNVVYNGVSISPVRFEVITDSCMDDSVELSVITKAQGLPIADEAGVKLLLLGGDACGMLDVTSSSPSVVINKTQCGLGYDVEFNFVIVSGALVDEQNSQQFKLICFHNMDNLTVETGNITDVDVALTDLQSVSEWASPTMQFVNPLDNQQILDEAVVGQDVRLLIQIPDEYRYDFDVKVIDCLMDDMVILLDGESTSRFLPEPTSDEQGVVYFDFPLFRPVNYSDGYRMNIVCTVETCVGNCAANRRKRSNAIFTDEMMMYFSVQARIIEHDPPLVSY